MRLRLALLLLTALLVIPAFASPDLVQVPCKRSDGTTYGSSVIFYRGTRVSAKRGESKYGELIERSKTAEVEQSWNPELWHFSFRDYSLSINWKPDSSQDARLSLHEAGLSFSSNLTFLNPNPNYQPPSWSVEKSDGNKTIEFPDAWSWSGKGDEYNKEPLLKANGAQANLSLSNLVVRVTLYGGQSGAEVDILFTFWLDVECYNETSQPPPSPPPQPPPSPQPQDTGVRVVAVILSSGGRFWDVVVPVNITYTVGESSGSVSGYTLFTRDFKVKSTGGVTFTVAVPRSGEAYLPLRVWSCSSTYGCSYSYVAGNLTQFTVYSSRYGYGLVQAGPLTGSYTLAYRIEYYYSGSGVRQDFTPVTIEAGSGDSWRTLATHDKPTDGVILLNVQLNNEYVRFKGGASGYASLATAAIAERAQAAFQEWGAVCSHISYCKFYTDCSGSSYSLGVCDNIPWGYVICPGSYCSWACDPYGVACLPLIALVDAGETGFLGFRYARTPSY
ncbi:MAG: hypothetical protein QXF87_08550, partial [Thermofilaceae archaeon]